MLVWGNFWLYELVACWCFVLHVILRKFFRSANFEGWLRHRQQEIRQKLELLHLEALGKAVSRVLFNNPLDAILQFQTLSLDFGHLWFCAIVQPQTPILSNVGRCHLILDTIVWFEMLSSYAAIRFQTLLSNFGRHRPISDIIVLLQTLVSTTVLFCCCCCLFFNEFFILVFT